MSINVSDAIKKIVGEQKTISLAGSDITIYPLTYAEYLTALEMAPKAIYSMEELEEYEKTGHLPVKTPDTEVTIAAIKQELYVIGVTLKKNDPNFDIKTLQEDMRIFYTFEPLFEEVWKLSSPSDGVLKKKDSV